MEPIAMLHADPLDILFENRNKSYGAYPLRKYYARRLLVSMGVMMTVVVILTALYLHFQTLPALAKVYYIPEIIPEAFQPQPKEKTVTPPPSPAAPRAIATTEYVKPVIVPDTQVMDPMPDQQQLNTTAIGTTSTTGSPDNGVTEAGNGNAGGTAATVDSTEAKSKIFEHAEQMPEFPGGIEALKRFLLKNLTMPSNDLDPGTVVKVTARFVVDGEGHVQDIEITRPADPSFNQEVKRVILKMPDWKPGQQNHRPVSVYFNLPVNFVTAD